MDKNGLGVQNIFHLVLKEIYSVYKTKNLTKERIKKYKMTKTEIFEKFGNLSENDLKARKNKEVYAKNDVILLLNAAEVKKKRREKNRCS